MKRFAKRSVLTLMVAAAFALGAHADDISLTLIPASGPVYGAAGQAVGWGFTLTDNNASEWVLLEDSYLVGGDNTRYGNYSDYIVNNFYVAGPGEGTTITSLWNQSAQTGTGEFDISLTPYGDSFSGTINVDYALFSEDPNSPSFDPDSIVSSGTFSDPVLVNPEPASWILMSLPFTLLMLFAWRRQAAALRP
jgi:hypothetical protein